MVSSCYCRYEKRGFAISVVEIGFEQRTGKLTVDKKDKVSKVDKSYRSLLP